MCGCVRELLVDFRAFFVLWRIWNKAFSQLRLKRQSRPIRGQYYSRSYSRYIEALRVLLVDVHVTFSVIVASHKNGPFLPKNC